MNVLEEFWYGNLDPAEYDTSPGPEYKELLQQISRNEDKLLATMTDTQKDLFSRYQGCVREFQAAAECLHCIRVYLEATEPPDFRLWNQAVLFYGMIILGSWTSRSAQE